MTYKIAGKIIAGGEEKTEYIPNSRVASIYPAKNEINERLY